MCLAFQPYFCYTFHFKIWVFGIPGLRHSGWSAFRPYFRSAFRPLPELITGYIIAIYHISYHISYSCNIAPQIYIVRNENKIMTACWKTYAQTFTTTNLKINKPANIFQTAFRESIPRRYNITTKRKSPGLTGNKILHHQLVMCEWQISLHI